MINRARGLIQKGLYVMRGVVYLARGISPGRTVGFEVRNHIRFAARNHDRRGWCCFGHVGEDPSNIKRSTRQKPKLFEVTLNHTHAHSLPLPLTNPGSSNHCPFCLPRRPSPPPAPRETGGRCSDGWCVFAPPVAQLV